jgi:hypothetical protein
MHGIPRGTLRACVWRPRRQTSVRLPERVVAPPEQLWLEALLRRSSSSLKWISSARWFPRSSRLSAPRWSKPAAITVANQMPASSSGRTPPPDPHRRQRARRAPRSRRSRPRAPAATPIAAGSSALRAGASSSSTRRPCSRSRCSRSTSRGREQDVQPQHPGLRPRHARHLLVHRPQGVLNVFSGFFTPRS